MIKNEKGVGLLIFMMVLVILILGLFEGLNRSLSEVNQQISVQKKVQAGLTALQEFGTMAQKANEAYNKNNKPTVTSTCPSPSTMIFDARGFCWPKPSSANHADCIRQPLSGGNRWLCLGGVQPNVIKFSVRDERGWWEKRRDQIASYSESVATGLARSLLYFDGIARAQAYKNHLPSLTGAPTATFQATYVPACAAGTNNNSFCKRCNPTGGNDVSNKSLLACRRLEICLRNDKCGTNDWVSQVVGVLSR